MASSKKLCCRRALTLLIHCRERKPPLLSPNSLLGQWESIYLLISVAPCSKQFSMLKEEFMFKFKKKSHLKTKKIAHKNSAAICWVGIQALDCVVCLCHFLALFVLFTFLICDLRYLKLKRYLEFTQKSRIDWVGVLFAKVKLKPIWFYYFVYLLYTDLINRLSIPLLDWSTATTDRRGASTLGINTLHSFCIIIAWFAKSTETCHQFVLSIMLCFSDRIQDLPWFVIAVRRTCN